MSIKLMTAVWDSSVRAPERFTLLALADRADEDGLCWPSVGHLVRKCRTSERTIQRHLAWLAESGYVIQESRPGHSNRYRLMATALPKDPPSDCHPRHRDTPPQSDTPTPVTVTPHPRHRDTHIHQEPSFEPKTTTAAPVGDGPTVNQRAQAITKTYHDVEPMCKFPAVMQTVKKAINSGRFSDEEITEALLRMAKEGRSVTVDALRTELQGFPPSRRPVRETATDRVNDWQALKDPPTTTNGYVASSAPLALTDGSRPSGTK